MTTNEADIARLDATGHYYGATATPPRVAGRVPTRWKILIRSHWYRVYRDGSVLYTMLNGQRVIL